MDRLVRALASFAGAALMLALSVAGVMHLRRTPPEVEVFAPLAEVATSR